MTISLEERKLPNCRIKELKCLKIRILLRSSWVFDKSLKFVKKEISRIVELKNCKA